MKVSEDIQELRVKFEQMLASIGWALLTLMLFECIAVSKFYGNVKFYEDIKDMIGYYPGKFWKKF